MKRLFALLTGTVLVVAACSGGKDAVDQGAGVAGDAGIGDSRPQRPLSERFLNVDDKKSTSHDYNYAARTVPPVRPDPVSGRTDPVTPSSRSTRSRQLLSAWRWTQVPRKLTPAAAGRAQPTRG